MNARTQRQLRRIHFWLGMFFAPTIIFFALTGTIQSLGFQDRHGDYVPPAWVSLVTNVHKHGDVRRPNRRPTADASKPSPRPAKDEHPLQPFSVFAALLGLLLTAATGLGIAIGVTARRDRPVAFALLIAGMVVPLGLLSRVAI